MNERTQIYDELCSILTSYEDGTANESDLYCMLCKIQNCWETVITADN